VLDLTDERGYMCGHILNCLGAEVIKIEPPGGDRGRYRQLHLDNPSEKRESFYWSAYNIGKKSVTLDITSEKGRQIFGQLVENANIVIESFRPGYLDDHGLGYEKLSGINPGIILTSITPYGQTGPSSRFAASDLTLWAGTGYMWLCGAENEAPLRFSIPQSFLHGGAEAAMGSLVALRHLRKSGEGQQVDVSIVESIMWECLSANATWDMNQEILRREGAFRVFGPYRIRFLYPCKDGYVIFLLLGGHIGARGQRALTKWMDEEGLADDFLKEFDWDSFDASTYSDALARKLEPRFIDFFMTKTKAELFAGALKMQYMLAPVNSVQDLLESTHFQARDFWRAIDLPEGKSTATIPGPPFKSNGPQWRKSTAIPGIGEHNSHFLGDLLGLSAAEISVLNKEGVI